VRKKKNSPFGSSGRDLVYPDLLAYLLTGKRACEYTEASTSQFLNPNTKQIEASLLEAAVCRLL
jgi:rhamnulokinase